MSLLAAHGASASRLEMNLSSIIGPPARRDASPRGRLARGPWGWCAGVFITVPILVVLSIWLPLWFHYWVPSPMADGATLTALRAAPVDQRLIEIDAQGRDLRATIPDSDVVQQAQRLLRGSIELPNGDTRSVSLPFDPKDYDGGSPGGALSMAALIVPATFLRAYELQHDEEFFRQAKDAILQFAVYERSIATDIAAVRNDHAIAARVGVLVRFWRLYRHRKDFNDDEARIVMQHVSRCALMLAKSSHYTAATNHGVMQNIALLQIASAFPALPESELARQTARQRLERQMAYYIHPEGVVLEHGAGYHRFGIWLVGVTIRLLEMNSLPEIPGLREKYDRGMTFLDRLTRPDGSIPRIGDTNGKIVDQLPPAATPDANRAAATDLTAPLADGTRVYAGSGYAITARRLTVGSAAASAVSHGTVYWSYFPRHGHEVAAEGSFLLWAAGRNWIGNTGYWPYGLAGRDESTGWRGSNALHLIGEGTTSDRATRLLGTAANDRVHLLDLQRALPGSATLRTQIAQVSDDSWMILDAVSSGGTTAIERVWTLDPGLKIERNEGGGVVATDMRSGWRLTIKFLTDQQPSVSELYGSLDPFGGWAVIGPRPIPSSAFVVSPAPGGQWLATVLTLVAPGKELPVQTPQLKLESADQWRFTFGGGTLAAGKLDRHGSELHVVTVGSIGRTLQIQPPSAEPDAQRAVIAQHLEAELRAFPKFLPFESYRWRLIKWLALPALAMAGIGLVVARFNGRLRRWLTLGATAAWGLMAGWIHLHYLAG